MKYIRLVLINIDVLFGLLLIVCVISYFAGVHRINTFFELTGPNHIAYLQKDSLAMFVHKPNIQIYDHWGTPQQKLTTERRTNNLGFREDADIVEKRPNEYRILVTGDSHTDGVLKHNPESFINIWEENLNASDSTTFYNCINGGTGYYTFRNYLGFLKKYKYLKPDIYLINVFTGNDFREAPMFEDDRTNVSNVFRNMLIRTQKKFYTKEKKEIPFTQGIEQTLYFKAFPSEKEKSMRLAQKYMLEIKALCAQENIKLIITLLPSKIETNPEFAQKIQQLFDLSDEEIQTNEQMTNQFLNWLHTENISTINLKKPLQQATEKVYWDQDLHINPNAHRIIGDYLYNNINFN
ncbi:MAG: hypothetical protein ACI87N_000135 [Flavobacteriales bacterium]|jgi:hypothetical protein